MSDCRDYFKSTGRRVTFEYTLMGGTNDGTQHVSFSVFVLSFRDFVEWLIFACCQSWRAWCCVQHTHAPRSG